MSCTAAGPGYSCRRMCNCIYVCGYIHIHTAAAGVVQLMPAGECCATNVAQLDGLSFLQPARPGHLPSSISICGRMLYCRVLMWGALISLGHFIQTLKRIMITGNCRTSCAIGERTMYYHIVNAVEKPCSNRSG